MTYNYIPRDKDYDQKVIDEWNKKEIEKFKLEISTLIDKFLYKLPIKDKELKENIQRNIFRLFKNLDLKKIEGNLIPPKNNPPINPP